MTDYEFAKATVLKKKIEAIEEFLAGFSVEYSTYTIYGDLGDDVKDYLFDIDIECFNCIRDHYTNRLEKLKKEFEEL